MNVTVIIPTLKKRKQMLKEAIMSVENQTVPTDYIVVSEPEDTWEKINKTVNEIDTEYFVVLSDDDMLDKTFIEKTMALAERWNADLVRTFLKNFGTEDGVHGPESIPFMTTLTSKRIWEKVGGYNPQIGIAADAEFFIRCNKAGASVQTTSEPLFLCRKHEGQWSNHGNWAKSFKAIRALHGNVI